MLTKPGVMILPVTSSSSDPYGRLISLRFSEMAAMRSLVMRIKALRRTLIELVSSFQERMVPFFSSLEDMIDPSFRLASICCPSWRAVEAI